MMRANGCRLIKSDGLCLNRDTRLHCACQGPSQFCSDNQIHTTQPQPGTRDLAKWSHSLNEVALEFLICNDFTRDFRNFITNSNFKIHFVQSKSTTSDMWAPFGSDQDEKQRICAAILPCLGKLAQPVQALAFINFQYLCLVNGHRFIVLSDDQGFMMMCRQLDSGPKSLYTSGAVRYSYKTKFEIWDGLGLLGK